MSYKRRRSFTNLAILLVFLLCILGGSLHPVEADTVSFTAEELLGKPTDMT